MLRHSSQNASSFDLKRPVVFIQYFRQKKLIHFITNANVLLYICNSNRNWYELWTKI